AENTDLKDRIADLEARLAAAQSTSLVSAPDSSAATLHPEPSSSCECDNTSAIIAAVVVPPKQNESSSITAQRVAVSHYIGKCITGQIAEIDFSQVPDSEEASIWAALSVHRFPTKITGIRMSNCRAQDRAVQLIAAILRVGCYSQILTFLDLTDNAITAD